MEKLILTRPVRSKRITQGFGENKACIDMRGNVIAKKGDTCPLGAIDFYKSMGMLGHNGIDIATIHGESVVHNATFDGWMKIEKDFAGGIGVDVVSNHPIKLNDGTESYIKIRYWHLKAPVGWDGKEVKYGQIIGLADNTGASSGDHLHWAPKVCDKHGNSLNKDNGYFGSFDATPYYTHRMFAGGAARMLNIPAPKPSPQELQEISSQLSLLKRSLLELRELLAIYV